MWQKFNKTTTIAIKNIQKTPVITSEGFADEIETKMSANS